MDRKVKLAYAYKIIAHLGLDDHTYTHLSVRTEDNTGFYIYPFGLRFEEVTPGILLKVSYNGEIIEGSEYQYNHTGYIIHGNIYKARPDINAIFHLHTPDSVAVSSMKEGLLPISQWALHFYEQLSYHDYNSLALDQSIHGDKMIQDLSDKYVMLLRNHGIIMCGKTIEEAMFYTHHLELACKAQVKALSMNREIITPDHTVCKQAVNDLLTFEKNLGERDWQAWVRLIDKMENLNVDRHKILSFTDVV